ncbi:MAG: hypothetical protein II198_02820, partial [Bacteroidaceae bacterium]|nr:hypothetical protein [Bacteroidaceae bacterium]
YSPNQCMDEAAEMVSAKISEVKQTRAAYIRPLPGYWPESAAATLDAKIAAIEATFAEEMTAEERAAQLTELDSALDAMKKGCTSANMNQPVSSTDENPVYYRMCTPLRENRYATGKGVGAEMVGEQTATDNATWKFVKRTDNTFNIINAVDGSYISPASDNNTALRTVADAPSAGWTVKMADAAGYVIITSGSAQFNQTNNNQLGYKVYNWGGGTNINDTGCKYVFEAAEYTPADVPTTTEMFYIAAHTKQGDGSYVDRYMYVNDNTLANNTTCDFNNANYKWELIPNGANAYHIKNGSGKYLSYANKSLTVADVAYSFQFQDDAIDKASGAKSLYNPTSSGGKYMVMAASGSGYNQNSTPVNNGSWCSDYILTSCGTGDSKPSLSIVSSTSLANATFSWNGHEITSTPLYVEDEKITDAALVLKAHNEAYRFDGFYADAAYNTPITEVSELTTSITIYAKFTFDAFSATYGDKLIRLKMFRDASYSAGIKNASSNAAGSTQVCDLTAT